MSAELSTLARRILALPPAVRKALAAVPGPGWWLYANTSGIPESYVRTDSGSRPPSDLRVWWPANPAAAVCAVCNVLPHAAHQLIADACPGLDEGDNDNEAALDVIEAHLRSRP